MSAEQRNDEDSRFLETCVKLKLLGQSDAVLLHESAKGNAGHVAQEAVRRGLLTPADVDIVQSLIRPSDVVPGYEILGLVGRGGMGVVYRASQIDLDRVVALKTVLISNVSNTTVAARFEREAKSLARLHHPNIVQALNFGKHQGRYFFAMELVEGRSCEQAIRQQGRLELETVWSIVRQVASGLLHALRNNLIHRDIKPANLILLPAPEGTSRYGGREIVKITDFGLAMFADGGQEQMRLTTGEKIMGSPAYMSPEQFGGGDVDFRADVYSLGGTAWHLIFGNPPFQGGNIAALLMQKNQPLVVDRATLPVQLPDNQWRLLMSMLDPDPEKRPLSYDVLIEAVDELGLSQSGKQVGSDSSQSFSDTNASSTDSSVARAAISDQVTMEVGTPPNSKPVHPGQPSIPIAGAVTPLSGGLSQTVELATPERRRGVGKRSTMIAAAVLLVVAAIAVVFIRPRQPTRGPRPYDRVVQSSPLFDGVTLSGWDVSGSMLGAWNTVEAPDASTAIACTTRQGALTRWVNETSHPRISLFVWLEADAGAVDIDFAVDPTEAADMRGSLRLDAAKITLGQKSTDFGDLGYSVTVPSPPTLHERYHVVHLERQPLDWYVFFEEKLVGTIPISRIGSGNAIRIVVHDQPAESPGSPTVYFSDVRLDNLAPSSET